VYVAVKLMTTILLTPTTHHCIQTVSKREYERLMQELLAQADENPELIAKLKLLYDFLQTADFGSLRAMCDISFTNGKKVRCLISRQTDSTGVTCSVTEHGEEP